MDCKYALLNAAETGISLLFSQLIENPERLPNLSMRVRRGGIDTCGWEMYKRISSAYSER